MHILHHDPLKLLRCREATLLHFLLEIESDPRCDIRRFTSANAITAANDANSCLPGPLPAWSGWVWRGINRACGVTPEWCCRGCGRCHSRVAGEGGCSTPVSEPVMRLTATFHHWFSEIALKHKGLQPLRLEQRSPPGIAVTLFHICALWD